MSPEMRERKRASRRKYYLRNRRAVIAKAKRWAAENPEKRKEIQRRYCERNREKIAVYEATRRPYYRRDPVKEKASRRRYYLKNSAKVKAWVAEYRAAHLKAVMAREAAYWARPEVRKAAVKRAAEWTKRNPTKRRAQDLRERGRLSGRYVRSLLRQDGRLRGIPIPEPLVNAKRAHIQLTRKLKGK